MNTITTSICAAPRVTVADALRSCPAGIPRSATLVVTGEVSDLNRPNSGHTYFRLADGSGVIPCVLFRGVGRQLFHQPSAGQVLAVEGWVQRSPKDGTLEIDVRGIRVEQPVGPIRSTKDALVSRLHEEGMTAPSRKRPIPAAPACIGIVTSPTGDVIHDVMSIIRKRTPGVPTQLVPVRVTGVEAAPEIAAAVRTLSAAAVVDVILVARGGGSAADLGAYDSEVVARAIAESRVPVVTAIGHEPDTTVADLVADIRCGTPAEAAETIVRGIAAAAMDNAASKATGTNEVRITVGGATIRIEVPASAGEVRVE